MEGILYHPTNMQTRVGESTVPSHHVGSPRAPRFQCWVRCKVVQDFGQMSQMQFARKHVYNIEFGGARGGGARPPTDRRVVKVVQDFFHPQ